MTTEVDPIPTPETLSKAGSGELYDIEGNKTTFSEIIKDHRVLIIFIRHFWCGICQGYVKQLSEYLPPTSLPADTKIVIIGCGSYEPIQWYQDLTQSQYPIYANPSLSLYQDFEFQSRLAVAKKGEEREYDKVLGSTFTKVWNAIKIGPMQNFGQRNQVGPKSQNGGEVVLQKDGSCTFFHRMQHTADHLDIKDVAEAIGVKMDSTGPLNGTGEGVSCEAGARQP